MNQRKDEIIRKRRKEQSLADKIICAFNACRYYLAEWALLRINRLLYGHLYRDPQESPLVSVYIPTYNRARLLIERSVPSVLAQTHKNFELVIVGDHCTDGTEKLLSEINDPRVRFYNLPTRQKRYPETAENHWFAGPVVPANTALGLLQGKWIARLDDDDIWTPDHLEVLLRFAQEGNYEFVSACYIEERHGKKTLIDEKETDPRIGGTQTWLYRSYLKFFRYNINCWRKAWNRVNDTDIVDRIYSSGVKMGFLEKVVVYILPRPGEASVGIEAYRLTSREKLDHFKFSQ